MNERRPSAPRPIHLRGDAGHLHRLRIGTGPVGLQGTVLRDGACSDLSKRRESGVVVTSRHLQVVYKGDTAVSRGRRQSSPTFLWRESE
ncbi:hypothetical protein [Stenotrophomonas nematodicola]|uniref:hypothetical protein n=1 Tax=Stenotrophomonas nematodicola TaxID=2656746 RepID=UPI0013FD05BC|nr:hypothetical protein [Stenotrophomonas nematodicola]